MDKRVVGNKLWKNIGVTAQKFDLDSSRSPSFDRSSLARSKQGRSISSQELSVNNKPQIKRKQSKIRQDIAFKNFCENVNQLGFQLKSVPQQDDLLYNSVITKKPSIVIIDEDPNDRAQLLLLQRLLKAKSKSIDNKTNQKVKDLTMKANFKKLKLSYFQLQKLINYQFKEYQNDIKKYQRLISSAFQEIVQNLFSEKAQNQKLRQQNQRFRQELNHAHRMIQQLQLGTPILTKKKSILKTSEMINKTNYDDQSRTVKHDQFRILKNNENNDKMKTIEKTPQHQKRYSKEKMLISQELAMSKEMMGRKSMNSKEDFDQDNHLCKRQRFKRFLTQKRNKNQLKQKAKNESEELPNQKINSDNGLNVIKFRKGIDQSIPMYTSSLISSARNITAVRFYRKGTPTNSNNNEQLHEKLTKLKSETALNTLNLK